MLMSKQSELNPQVISRWMGLTAVMNLIERTNDLDICEENPFFPLARAYLLNKTMREKGLPKERREVLA